MVNVSFEHVSIHKISLQPTRVHIVHYLQWMIEVVGLLNNSSLLQRICILLQEIMDINLLILLTVMLCINHCGT